MDTSEALKYLGLSGFVVSTVTTVIYVARRLCRSKCVRGQDNQLHLDISFNTSEIQAINDSQELREMLNGLRAEIQRRSNRNVQQGEPAEPEPVQVAVHPV